jgi:hypothetical protein
MLVSLAFAIFYSIIVENYLILFTSFIVGIIIITPKLFRWKYNLVIPLEIELVALIFIYGTLFLGEALFFYHRFWWWDILLHTGSAIVFGFVGFIVLYYLYSHHQVETKTYTLGIFSFSFAIAIGVIWEIFEFFMDRTFGLNMQKSGLVDTMGDLIVDAFGALLASFIGYLYLKTKKTVIFHEVAMKFVKK